MPTESEPAERWYLTQKRAAAVLNVEPRVVRRMVERGDLETVVLANKSYILARSVRNFLDRVVGDDEARERNGTPA